MNSQERIRQFLNDRGGNLREIAETYGVCYSTARRFLRLEENSPKLCRNFHQQHEDLVREWEREIARPLQVAVNQLPNDPLPAGEENVLANQLPNEHLPIREGLPNEPLPIREGLPNELLPIREGHPNEPLLTREQHASVNQISNEPHFTKEKPKIFTKKNRYKKTSRKQQNINNYTQPQNPQTAFSFFSKGRRVETFYNKNYNKEVKGHFYDYLINPKSRPDITYPDLYEIAKKTLGQKDSESQEAIETAITNFSSENPDIFLNEDLNLDLQLLVHHLLKFQYVNLQQLLDTSENKNENSFRENEMSLIKNLIKTKLLNDPDKILPPKPIGESDKALQYAMPALVGLNRQISRSVFNKETSKAVFQLTRKICRKAYCKAEKTEYKPRVYYNESMFKVLNKKDFQDSKMKSRKYIVENFGVKLSEATNDNNESFIVLEPNESEFLNTKIEIGDQIFQSDATFREAEKARKMCLNTLATFSKLTCKKELIDDDNEVNRQKYRSFHERISRLYEKANNDTKLKKLCKEIRVYETKQGYIEKIMASIMKELEILGYCIGLRSGSLPSGIEKEIEIDDESPFHNEIKACYDNTEQSLKSGLDDLSNQIDLDKTKLEEAKLRIKTLERRQSEAQRLQQDLEEFYTNTSIKDLFDDDDLKWKNNERKLSGKGEAKIRNKIYGRDENYRRQKDNNERSSKEENFQGNKDEKSADQKEIEKSLSEQSESESFFEQSESESFSEHSESESFYEQSENESLISQSKNVLEETKIEEEKVQNDEITNTKILYRDQFGRIYEEKHENMTFEEDDSEGFRYQGRQSRYRGKRNYYNPRRSDNGYSGNLGHNSSQK